MRILLFNPTGKPIQGVLAPSRTLTRSCGASRNQIRSRWFWPRDGPLRRATVRASDSILRFKNGQ
jgi:hypothetical protein